jgi:predicted acylesterase/phospholipase RssA
MDPRSELYDYRNVRYLYTFLSKLRKNNLTKGLVYTLRSNLHKNLYGIANPLLYEKWYTGTKYQIDKLQKEIIKSLLYIYNCQKITIHQKVKFFSEIRHWYGRTALMFSGGASMGVYHLGCIKVLQELDLCPRIIWGSSAGSIFASLVCTRTYDDLSELYDPYSVKFNWFGYKESSFTMMLARFLKDGVLMDIKVLQDFLKRNLGDLTFQEAYEKTGWILNVSVSSIHQRDIPRLLNYVTSPHVLIWSAVSASWAIPKVFESVELYWKDTRGKIVPYTATKNHTFIDGSVAADLPMQRLSEIFNVNTFIVSQVNPFVIPFINDDGGGVLGTENTFSKKIRDLINNEIVHVVNLLSSLGLMPEKVERVAGIATQNYKGHVTISPKVRFGDYLKMLRNPSPEYIEEACKLSQHNTYPKIRLIKSIYEIEKEINNCYCGILEQFSTQYNIINDIQFTSPKEMTTRQRSGSFENHQMIKKSNLVSFGMKF